MSPRISRSYRRLFYNAPSCKANCCISSVPLARFVMLDEELHRGLCIKVSERKTFTRGVIGRFDLSVPPSVPPHMGGWQCRGGSRTARTMSAAHAGGWLPAVLFFCHLLLVPRMRGDKGGLNPAQGIESLPPLSLRGAPKGRRGNPLRYPEITPTHAPCHLAPSG